MPLDQLEEHRRPVLDRLGEDLQQVAVFIPVGQDAQLPQFIGGDPGLARPVAQRVVVTGGRVQEVDKPAARMDRTAIRGGAAGAFVQVGLAARVGVPARHHVNRLTSPAVHASATPSRSSTTAGAGGAWQSGAVVVIVSDGWDGGDPARVGEQIARLARLAHRIVWVNHVQQSDRYEPTVGGMSAALPYVDAFVSGHSLAAMDDVLAAIAGP